MIAEIIQIIYGILIMFIIFAWIVSLTHLSWYVVLGAIVAIILFIYCIAGYRERKRRKEIEARPCKHGTIGAFLNEKLCSQCVDEKSEKERLEQIKKIADDVKRSEILRLKQARTQRINHLYSLTPQDFEDVIATAYRQIGYKVKQTPYSNDGGKDAIAWKGNKKYLIECKRYATDKPVGRPLLQKFFAAMVEEKAEQGFFVTTGYFTSTVYEYAKETNIELVNSDRLAKLMQVAFPDKGDADSFKVVCEHCGDVVILSFDKNETKCIDGHLVRANIDENMLTSSWNAEPQYRKKRRRSRRYYY